MISSENVSSVPCKYVLMNRSWQQQAKRLWVFLECSILSQIVNSEMPSLKKEQSHKNGLAV